MEKSRSTNPFVHFSYSIGQGRAKNFSKGNNFSTNFLIEGTKVKNSTSGIFSQN